jgi:hypothetical protein
MKHSIEIVLTEGKGLNFAAFAALLAREVQKGAAANDKKAAAS